MSNKYSLDNVVLKELGIEKRGVASFFGGGFSADDVESIVDYEVNKLHNARDVELTITTATLKERERLLVGEVDELKKDLKESDDTLEAELQNSETLQRKFNDLLASDILLEQKLAKAVDELASCRTNAKRAKTRQSNVKRELANSYKKSLAVTNSELVKVKDELAKLVKQHGVKDEKKRATKNGVRKLTCDIVRSIRKMFSEGTKEKYLSNHFKVARSTISRIVNNKTYTDC